MSGHNLGYDMITLDINILTLPPTHVGRSMAVAVNFNSLSEQHVFVVRGILTKGTCQQTHCALIL